MLNLSDIDQRFRLLQEEVIHSYEQRLKRKRETYERSVNRLQRREEEVRDILRASQLDLERFDHLIRENEASLRDFLREERPSVVERPISRAEDKKRFSLYSSLHGSNHQRVPVYAATLLASDHANVEGNPGERGNPWVLPQNPGQVKIKGSESGHSWGCYAQPTVPGTDASAVFWFPFTPDVTGTWYLNALINLFGFYILRANGEWWNCQESVASLEAIVDVYQYYWNGQKHFSLLHIDQGDIHDNERADIYGEFDYSVGLGAGDLTWVMVMINLHTFAKGGGTYSEVNFSDGTANYIEPLIVVAAPPRL